MAESGADALHRNYSMSNNSSVLATITYCDAKEGKVNACNSQLSCMVPDGIHRVSLDNLRFLTDTVIVNSDDFNFHVQTGIVSVWIDVLSRDDCEVEQKCRVPGNVLGERQELVVQKMRLVPETSRFQLISTVSRLFKHGLIHCHDDVWSLEVECHHLHSVSPAVDWVEVRRIVVFCTWISADEVVSSVRNALCWMPLH